MVAKSYSRLIDILPMGRCLWAPRVYLRRFSIADSKNWFQLLYNNQNWFKPWLPPYSDGFNIADIQKVIRQAHIDLRHNKCLDTGIFRRSDDMLIGKISLHNITWGILRSAGFGFYLGEEFVGHGFMTEALSTMIAFAFEEGRFHRLWGGVQTRNLASQRVFKKLGFTCDGIHREELFIDKQWQDQYFFTILETEYDRLADTWIKKGWMGG